MPASHSESALHRELTQAALHAAQSIQPRVREIELNRSLPQDIAEQLAQAGLYRMLTPRCYGKRGLKAPLIAADEMSTIA